jgi:hypothetical protein
MRGYSQHYFLTPHGCQGKNSRYCRSNMPVSGHLGKTLSRYDSAVLEITRDQDRKKRASSNPYRAARKLFILMSS